MFNGRRSPTLQPDVAPFQVTTALPNDTRGSEKTLGDATVDLLLAAMWGLFAYAQLRSFWLDGRISSLLVALFETIVLVMFLARTNASFTSFSLSAWVTTIGGTYAPLLLRPMDQGFDNALGTALQIVGAVLQIAAICSLNRSMALLPALRRVKTDGLYRLVRHPLYLSYLVAQVGYVINNPTAWNISLVLVATLCQIGRIANEEAVLLTDEHYADYAGRVRWHLVPGVW
ncbi:MAG: methyltransferase [Geminicoccaceae bacterium]